jgi:TatA/E family protein of Tat protein translocase
MFGSLGFQEILLILAIALLVFGPKKLPEVGKSIGKAMREFRKTSDEIRGKIEEEINAEEFKEIKKDIDEVTNIHSDFYAVDPAEDDSPKEESKAASPKENDKSKSTQKKDSKKNGEGKKIS